MAESSNSAKRTYVWDWPTRVFHWLLVVLLGLSWWSAENHAMIWHYRSGLAVLALVIFRVIWGLIGTSTARFGQFLKGPGAIVGYLTGKGWSGVGHNPVGGWSVALMLILLAAQVSLGLFAVDVDGLESGPLSYLVSFDAGRSAAEWHEVVFTALQVVVAFHVLAILFYLVVRKTNLVGPMVTGSSRSSGWVGEPVRSAPAWRFVIAAAVAGVATWFIANGLAFL